MEEEVVNSANNEAAPHETEVMEPVAQQQETEGFQAKNFREMRERQKQLESELRQQRELNDKFMTMVASHTPPPAKEVDEFDSIGDDEYIPKGKVNQLVEKRATKIAQEIAQRETEKMFKQRDASKFMDKLKSQYADFDDVVNSDTLAILEQQDPELASTIVELKDPYKIGMQSYKYIKAMNLAQKVPESRRAKEIDKKLENNAKTVPSPQVYDKRPMAQAFKLTEEDKKSLYREMQEYASQAGFSY